MAKVKQILALLFVITFSVGKFESVLRKHAFKRSTCPVKIVVPEKGQTL